MQQTSILCSNSCKFLRYIPPFTGAVVSVTRSFSLLTVLVSGGMCSLKFLQKKSRVLLSGDLGAKGLVPQTDVLIDGH
jgi:hypothetical protein